MQAPTQTSGPIGVVLVGGGRIGKVHYANIIANSRLQLKYIVDVDLKTAEEYASKIQGCKALSKIDEALQDSSVKGVIICTPTAAHPEAIIASVRSGRAVMCEKPISLKVSEIDECYEEAKKAGVHLLCGYQRRHDPTFVALQEQCKKGTIGNLQIVKTISRDNPVPTIAYLKISGGIFHDCGSHDIDLCRWITGEDPYEVYCTASCFNPEIKAIDDFDTVIMTLKFPSGIIGSIDLSRKAAYGYDQRIEVLGDKGMCQSNNRQPTATVVSTESGINSDTYCYSFPQRYVEAYANELAHFADLLEGKVSTPKLSHDDARKVAIIADAAEESARKGVPVKIKY